MYQDGALAALACMQERDLCRQQPRDIDEAVECMRATLVYYHAHHDKRAIFLRLYYIMTLEVQAAIYGTGVYAGQRIFLDPEWIRRLSGKFATRYFAALAPEPASKAWRLAYTATADKHSPVVENALLGINAHINFDLPQAISANLSDADLASFPTMQIRKFDHDQVNNLLIRVLNPIQDTLARDYEPGIFVADRMLGDLDEELSELALKYYRERVWWDALAHHAACARGDGDVVADKLDWESYKIAQVLTEPRLLWALERDLNDVVSIVWTRDWSHIKLEQSGGVLERSGPINIVHANPRRIRVPK